MPTQNWSFPYGGHEVRVENYWNLLGWSRERLYLNGRLADEDQGFFRTRAKLTGLLRDPSGETHEVKTLLGVGFLGLSVVCKVWIDSELVFGDADDSPLAPPTSN